MKGQLSSFLTKSTVRSSQADSSWTPKFLPELRRLDEVVVGAKTILAFGETSAGEMGKNIEQNVNLGVKLELLRCKLELFYYSYQ